MLVQNQGACDEVDGGEANNDVSMTIDSLMNDEADPRLVDEQDPHEAGCFAHIICCIAFPQVFSLADVNKIRFKIADYELLTESGEAGD